MPYELTENLVDYLPSESRFPSTVTDWIRVFREGNLNINGKPLSEYPLTIEDQPIQQYLEANDQETTEKIKAALNNFFKTNLLGKTTSNEEHKKVALKYLMKNLHQGGLLYAMPLSIGQLFSAKGITCQEVTDKRINLIPTSRGFMIVETGKFKQLFFASEKKRFTAPSQRHLLGMNTQFDVDFTVGGKQGPTITLQESEMTFPDPRISKRLQEKGMIREAPKWEKFHTKHSAIQIRSPSQPVMDNGGIITSWQTAVAANHIKINGKRLSDYSDDYDGFKDKASIERFFDEVLLKHIQGDKHEARAKLINYFSQQMALAPVSSAASSLLTEAYSLENDEAIKMKKCLHIVSTRSGIKLQEFVQVTQLNVVENENTREIHPDPGKLHLMKCQAIIDLNVVEPELSATIESNTLSYGNTEIQNRFDERSLVQKLIDIFCRVFNINCIPHLSDETHENTMPEESTSSITLSQ